MAKLDERTLRREDALLSTSEPVRLADGQDWLVPKPRVLMLPTDDVLGYEQVRDFGDEEFDPTFGEAMRAYESAVRAALDEATPDSAKSEQWDRIPGLKLRVYRVMLARNYALSLEQERRILALEPGGEIETTLWALATGQTGKKAQAAGDDLDVSLAV